MADSLPVTIQMGALPVAVKWTPQQLADAMVARMRLVTAQTFALFVAGSTEPGSNSGPWLKNDSEWWVWSNVAGAYVPITIPAASLGYFIGENAPDQNVYAFWIQTTALGSPLALKIYYSGAWVDVYAAAMASYLTIAAAAATYAPLASPALTGTPTGPTAAPGTNTAQIASTAFVAAAIAGIPSVTIVAGQGIFRAGNSGTQNVVFGGGGNMTGVISLGAEVFDPDNCFAADVFTAPANGYYSFGAEVSTGISGGAPTNLDIIAQFAVNGTPGDSLNNEETGGTAGQTIVGVTTIFLSAGDTVGLAYNFTSDAAVTVEILGARLDGYRIR